LLTNVKQRNDDGRRDPKENLSSFELKCSLYCKEVEDCRRMRDITLIDACHQILRCDWNHKVLQNNGHTVS
jgi:hypothetical protein